MSPRYGHCWNTDYCPVAHAHTLVCVDDSQWFVCPECTRPLRAAAKRGARFSQTPRLAAGGAVLLVAAAAAAWLWPAAHKPAPLPPVWVRMEPPPAPPFPVTVTVTPVASRPMLAKAAPPPAVVVAPVPVVALAPVAAETPSVLMRLRGEPALADQLVPQLARAFLRSTGDTDVEIWRSDSTTEVRGRSSAGLEAVSIVAVPPEAAFASLANGGTELVFSTRAPTTGERRALGRFQDTPLTNVAAGMAALFAPVPADPVATSFMVYAGSAGGRAALVAAGFAPPPPPAPPPKTAKRVPAPPINKPAVALFQAPAKAPAVTAARPVEQPAPKQATAPPPAPAPKQAAAPAPAPAPVSAGPAPVAANALPAGARRIVLPAGSKITFGPLKDVEMPAANPRMIFLQPGKTPRPPGKMQVDCMIQISGVPTDCRQVSENGGSDVSGVILAWLGSGAIRYSPAIKNGHPVKERRVLTVNFREPSAQSD
jgi:hypothetical protein